MKNHLFSPGKLLITSEYFVLDGALALAVPTRLGQDFFWEEIENDQSIIIWEAFHENHLWLSVKINYHEWRVLETNLPEKAQFIMSVLKTVQQRSKIKFQSNTSYHIRTCLQFPANYGWGSSSTLLNNLADFAQIDPYLLNEKVLGGSGYDIAVAKERTAIVYQNNPRTVRPITFNPPFLDDLILVHLNQKQDSREGIKAFEAEKKSLSLKNEFTKITEDVLHCDHINDFSSLMSLHESKLSNHLRIKTVKEKHFNDCPVFVKSLGAWGGDFVLSRKFEDYDKYFSARGFSQIYLYHEVVY